MPDDVDRRPAVDPSPNGYLRTEDCHLDDLVAVLEEGEHSTAASPSANRVQHGVPVYDAPSLRSRLTDASAVRAAQAEIAQTFAEGAGIAVFAGAFDRSTVDRVTAAFERIIAQEKATGRVAGDHFAAPGANDRVWNALEKLAIADPEAFVDYYSNDVLALAAAAWLGPGYQVTSQVNVVNPGGAGQTVHRDYHLGFQSLAVSGEFPAHVHALSAVLTLQGAVAHCDMPVETGPTLYLPHSQKYHHGYLAYWLPEFQEYFVDHHLQLPLHKGDAVFFNPALFHAAGSNRTTTVRRMANLLQISSAFGRAMETVDRRRVVEAIYPVLLSRAESGTPPALLTRVIAASAEGYAFPTNLDRDQPIDGMSPRTQADIVDAALVGRVPLAGLRAQLAAYTSTRLTS
jgi:ectoine hydroxylase-related dioxygenase (phytanoyl-CoA dioxygenase family)